MASIPLIFIYYICIFLTGIFIGSFLNVVIDRLPEGQDIIWGRSHCDHCGKILSPLDLIPIASFISLRGKCRYCHKKLSMQYPFIETVTGFLFVSAFYLVKPAGGIGQYVSFLYAISLFTALLAIFMIDLKTRIIPDEILIFMFTVTLGYYLYSCFFARMPFEILLQRLLSGIGFFLFFLFLTVITKGKGMGLGDVKFAFLMGFVLGYPNLLVAFYSSFLTGSAVSLILILINRKTMKDTIPFGPFLAFATLVSFVFGNSLLGYVFTFL